MNYKQIIDYLAFVLDSNDTQISELDYLVSIIKKHYSDIELTIYNRVLVEKLKAQVTISEQYLNTALNLGTTHIDYDFKFDNKRYTRNLNLVIQFWKLSIVYFEEKAKLPTQPELSLNFENLPDFLTPEQLTNLMGWTKSTIATKHSRNELAGVEGTNLTPKQGLRDYLNKKTKGLYESPELWLEKEVMKKKSKPKSTRK